MPQTKKIKVSWPWTIFSTLVAMVGYHMHGSALWTIADFIFSPIALLKWLVCHELTMTVIRDTFSFFFA